MDIFLCTFKYICGSIRFSLLYTVADRIPWCFAVITGFQVKRINVYLDVRQYSVEELIK